MLHCSLVLVALFIEESKLFSPAELIASSFGVRGVLFERPEIGPWWMSFSGLKFLSDLRIYALSKRGGGNAA